MKQVKSLDEAIELTMKKYNYNEETRKKIYEKLENKDFSCITSDFGAREFVRKYYLDLDKIQNPFENFTNLTYYFNKILKNNHLAKTDQSSYSILLFEMFKKFDSNDREKVEELMIRAANLYSENKECSGIHKIDFDMPNLTRLEATYLTSIFSKMENQKYQVKEALIKNPNYRKELISNLILYSYYENDYSISLDDQIEDIKSEYVPVSIVRK